MPLHTPQPPSPRPAAAALLVATVLMAGALAGCVQQGGAGGDDGPGSAADGEDPVVEARFDDFEAAKASDGPTLRPADEDGPVRAKLIAPDGFQALDLGPREFVVLVFDQQLQEPVQGATVDVETDRGESVRLAEDAHGVYAGELELTGVGETAARIAVRADGSALVFPLEIASYAAATDVDDVDALVYPPYLGDQELRLRLLSPDDPLAVPKAGPGPFTFQLMDGDGAPIEDVDVRLKSWMPPHGLAGGETMPGHGTHSEVDPVHHRFGVYQGQFNPAVMGGGWWTDVTVTVNGTRTVFRVTVDVHDDDRMSFAEALAADGPETNLTDDGSAAVMTAKLLAPDAGNAPAGNQTVRVLLHHPEAGRPAPVIDGDVSLQVQKQGDGGDTVEAFVSEVSHANSGIWRARANLTEAGTWTVRVAVEDGGSVATGELLVHVG